MITSIANGFIAELELVVGNLFMEIFAADRAFRPIQLQQVAPVNTSTTSTVTFTDARLFNGFQYFTRFLIESGGLFSGESEFLGFVPIAPVLSEILLESGDFLLLEDGSKMLNEVC